MGEKRTQYTKYYEKMKRLVKECNMGDFSFVEDRTFDEYGEYHFNHKEWHQLIDEAFRILAVDDFNSLFDEFIERQGKGNFLISKLICYRGV